MYAGIAPVTESSGKKRWVHWRLRCPKFLRQTFVEWAAKTIQLLDPSGPALTIGSSGPRGVHTRPPYGHWPSSGSAFSIAVGKRERHMMSPRISNRLAAGVHRYLLRSPWQQKPLDSSPQGVTLPKTVVREATGKQTFFCSSGPRFAVGMPITGHPPHRSVRAEFPHTVLIASSWTRAAVTAPRMRACACDTA